LASLNSLVALYHTNNHFLTDTTKDEKWLVLVGRPSLPAMLVRTTQPLKTFQGRRAVGRESEAHPAFFPFLSCTWERA
jgi:hypothetical protein